ncbi:flagellar basal body P-ring formation chaperone FlgA [Roseovarius sp. MMSF_3281]|uniref:flagellar basal body P-ring formation chaperone FlgA n=1 Tax=Roseovarius sp. MMSF_3281 TaxID=3046694 RepID=UPI0035318D0A
MRLAAFLLALGAPAMADTVLAARTIRAQSIIGPGDVMVKPVEIPGAATTPEAVIGLEARVSLYAGRPIRMGDLGKPALVDRNQIVPLIFERNGLRITTEGRSLGRAGAGEVVRVMNMSSRNTVSGRVLPDGRIMVSR